MANSGEYASDFSDAILKDVSSYTKDCTNEINKVLNRLQGEMLNEIVRDSPVRKYPYNGGTVGIIAQRRSGKTKAQRRNARHQPGDFKTGWAKTTLKDKRTGGTVKAVRNKKYPTLVHLLNFDHKHKSHGDETGLIVHGTKFVTNTQEKYNNILDKEIKNILNK